MIKKCNCCGKVYEADNVDVMNRYFAWQNKSFKKLTTQCKECVRRKTNKYNFDNREMLKAKKSLWRENNKSAMDYSNKIRSYYSSICVKNLRVMSDEEVLKAREDLSIRLAEIDSEIVLRNLN